MIDIIVGDNLIAAITGGVLHTIPYTVNYPDDAELQSEPVIGAVPNSIPAIAVEIKSEMEGES